MNKAIVTIGDKSAKHFYNVDAEYIRSDGSQVYTTVDVHASSRSKAASLVKQAGYLVRSVNTIG